MSLHIVPLRNKHLEDAAALVTAHYRALRRQVSPLPPRYEELSSILPLLRDLAEHAPGVAAIRGERLVGFLLAMVIPEFRGQRGAYSPEWANGAQAEGGREIHREMYAYLSARWAADGCFTHAITLLAHDREAIDAWHWLGFGLAAVDAIRDLAPLQGTIASVEIRRAGLEDIEEAMMLDQALHRHLAAAPIFLIDDHGGEFYEQWLVNSDNVLWLAQRGREAVACIGLEPSSSEACYITRDEGTASITSAFTQESERNSGIGTALLKHSLDWARSAGYQRCAVDFEPQNISAVRFWLRHFQPVCYSQIRNVDKGPA